MSLYEAGAFDVVIDDLAEANWVGATSVKSAAYFRQLNRILAPAGVLVYRGNYGNAREAILAGLLESFRVVREHERGVVLCSDGPLAFDRERAERVLTARERILAIPRTPYAQWLIEGLRAVSAADLGGAAPIRDDLLVYEYGLDPLRALLGEARREGGPRQP